MNVAKAESALPVGVTGCAVDGVAKRGAEVEDCLYFLEQQSLLPSERLGAIQYVAKNVHNVATDVVFAAYFLSLKIIIISNMISVQEQDVELTLSRQLHRETLPMMTWNVSIEEGSHKVNLFSIEVSLLLSSTEMIRYLLS